MSYATINVDKGSLKKSKKDEAKRKARETAAARLAHRKESVASVVKEVEQAVSGAPKLSLGVVVVGGIALLLVAKRLKKKRSAAVAAT